MKIVIVFLLIMLSMGQIVNIVDKASNTSNSTGYANTTNVTITNSPFVNVPLNSLTEVDTYLLQQIISFYPYLIDYNLTSMQDRPSPDGQKTQIAFTFDVYTKNATTNVSLITNETIVLVLAADNMTYFVYYDGQTINYSNYTEYLINQRNPQVGNKQSANISQLDAYQVDAQNFLLQTVPKLQGWTLVSLKTQVVAGENYCFDYYQSSTNKTEQYCVWSQPWHNFMQITFPNGTNITNQPASANVTNQTAINNSSNNNTNSTNSPPNAGGISPSDINNLNPDQVKAEKFVLDNVPKLSTWQLVSLETQVVSGMKYCFTFKDPVSSKSEVYCVWSQPWNNNFMQLTLPDNSTITNNGSSSNTSSNGVSIISSNSTQGSP